MTKIDKHIEIVGSSDDRFSCMGPKTREAIRAILARRYRTVEISIVNTPADLQTLVLKQPDLVFLTMKSIVHDGERTWISEFLDDHGIIYTGSPANAIKLEASKELAKQRVLDAGLATARYKIITDTTHLDDAGVPLAYPLFVKPNNRGGGSGIDSNSFVTDREQLATKVEHITSTLRADALVEEYLPGREFSVAVLQDISSNLLSAMPIELVAQPDARGTRMLSKLVKSSNTEQVSVVSDPKLRIAVCKLARDVFEALGARDYGRIDIRLDSLGVPHFLEANLYPSLMSGYGSFPKANELNSRRSYPDMILAIAELGMARVIDDVEELPSLFGEFATA